MRIRKNPPLKNAAKVEFGNHDLIMSRDEKNKKGNRDILLSLLSGFQLNRSRAFPLKKCNTAPSLKNQTLSLIASVNTSFLELLTAPTRKISNDKLDIDYIIPVANVNPEEFPHRLKALQTLVNHLPSNVHVVLVEQRVSSKLPTYGQSLIIPDHITYTWKKVQYSTFNKAWLNNIAARIAKTSHLLFAESDMVVDEKYIQALLKFISNQNPQWAVGWSHLIYWQKDMKKIQKIHWHSKCAQGGLIYFNKNFYWKVGGFNEAFENLSGIDNEMYTRASFYVKPKKLVYTVHHMWHPASKLKIHHSRKTNIKLYKSTKNNTRDINKKIQSVKHRFGNIAQPYTAVFK